jgi:zinc transporter ZupT
MTDTLLSAAVALLFALTHAFGAHLAFLHHAPRSIWLSLAGGVSVAYVFVHLLPELAEHQEAVHRAAEEGGLLAAVESQVWLIALVGLAIFYGLERLARSGAQDEREAGRPERPPRGVFWVHLVSFAVYNLIVGYLLVHREGGVSELAFYGFAMALHFLVNDHGLRAQHGHAYHREGRWLLAAAPVAGWALGLVMTVPELALTALFALIAGGIVLNVLKEELPEDRDSRFWAFAAGAGSYAALLIAVG